MRPEPISVKIGVYDPDMKNGRPTKSENTDFAERLRTLREAAGLSQREMARRLEISQPSYLAWETYNVALKPEQVTSLAEALGVEVGELFGIEAKPGKRGRTAKIEQVFDTVSELPRSKQQRIVGVVEALLAQETAPVSP